jgi:hypothetical protein
MLQGIFSAERTSYYSYRRYLESIAVWFRDNRYSHLCLMPSSEHFPFSVNPEGQLYFGCETREFDI